MSTKMSRNILELKSIKIAPEKVQTLAVAKRIAKLKDFDLKEEYFEMVCHPADLVTGITSLIMLRVILTRQMFQSQTSKGHFMQVIMITTGWL